MNTHPIQTYHPTGAVMALGALLICATAAAAPSGSPAAAEAQYRQERAVCTSGTSNQDRSTCMREAGAAYAEAKRGTLGKGDVDYAKNAHARCEKLQDTERTACMARMDGQGTTSGSVAGGGIYRELVTREVGPLVSVGPAGAASAAPMK
jgi:hypothetical protein